MTDITTLSDKELLKTIGNFIENAPIAATSLSAPDGTEAVTTCQCCGGQEPGYVKAGETYHYDHCKYKQARAALMEIVRRNK